jgi:hypothetical protein
MKGGRISLMRRRRAPRYRQKATTNGSDQSSPSAENECLMCVITFTQSLSVGKKRELDWTRQYLVILFSHSVSSKFRINICKLITELMCLYRKINENYTQIHRHHSCFIPEEV